MPITYAFSADWDRDGFTCLDARPGDPLNLVTTPLTWTDWAIIASSGGSDLQVTDVTPYGTQFTDWTSGTNATAHLQHGGSLDAITPNLAASAPYTLICWARSTSAAFDSVALALSVYTGLGALIATGAPITLSHAAGWTRLALSFTAPASPTGIFFRLGKVNSTTSVRLFVGGMMVVPGTFTASDAPGFNVGAASNGYDDLTPFVLRAEWALGATAAYQPVGATNTLVLSLNNLSRAFSPEDAASALAGLLADRIVRVEAQSDTSLKRTLFFGYVQSVQPEPGAHGPYTARLLAASSRRYWEGKQVQIALQTAKRADQVVSAIQAEITRPPSPLVINALEPGTFTWAYAGDNWEDGVDALAALATVVEAERGFAYWSRDDALVFRNRTWRYDFDDVYTALDATFDDAQLALDYDYGLDVVNDVEVTFYPRKLGASTTALLWELQESISLPPSSSETIFARYTNGDQDTTVGAVPATVAVGTFTTSGTINATLSARSQGCIITLTNPSASATRTVTAMTLTGQRISAFNNVTVRREDAASIAAYGRRTARLDLALVNARADARQIADLEIARFKDPRGHVRRVTVAGRDAASEATLIDLTLGQKVRVIEAQTAHDARYMVIGERHEVGDGLTTHRATYLLEPARALV